MATIAPLLREIRDNAVLWLLIMVPAVFLAQALQPEAHTLLFVLSVLAIVPLATLLSHATESVAARTGDAVGGLLNATLGNLTELIIALAALRRTVHPGEGIHRRSDCHQHAFHVGGVISDRRPQAPRAGLQPGQRPPPDKPPVSRRCRDAGSVNCLGRWVCCVIGVHPQIERGPVGAAHRDLCVGPGVLA